MDLRSDNQNNYKKLGKETKKIKRNGPNVSFRKKEKLAKHTQYHSTIKGIKIVF